MPIDFATIGEHFIIGFNGHNVETCDWKLLEAVRPAGVVLFARNIGTRDELRKLIDALKTRLSPKLLVAVDQEGHRVNRLRNIIGELPPIADVKRTGVRRFGREVAKTLRDLGFTTDFAPVLDLGVHGDGVANSLAERCWGRTAAEVSRWGGEFLDGLQAEGITGCAKHFPGLGYSTCDSHDVLPVVKRTREQILAEDAQPYRCLLGQLPMVMVGHAYYPELIGTKSIPASLSAAIVSDLLRQELKFEGVVVTDDMEMGAVGEHCPTGEAGVTAFKAGVDMLLVCHSPTKILEAHDALRTAVQSGEIQSARLEESKRRLEAFRQRWL